MNEKLIRRKKWWKWAAWPLGILLVLYLTFWIALFNPLEQPVDHLESLLPGDKREAMTYFIRGPWGEIRKSDFFRDNFLESPVREKVERAAGLDTEYDRIADIERQINESIPGFLGEFRLENEFLGSEVVLTGYLTGNGETLEDQVRNSPFVALTRLSFKAKFIEALKYSFVRDKVPGLTQREDWFEYDLAEATGEDVPEHDRYRYFARVKDVLAISNDEELIEKVTRYGLAGGTSTESLAQHYWFYYDMRSESPPNAISAWVRVSQADLDLDRKLAGYDTQRTGSATDVLRELFPVPYTTSMLVRMGAQESDRMPIRGVVRMRDKFPDAYKHLRGLHRLDGFPIRESAIAGASLMPAEGTFAFAWLRMDPQDFFKVYFQSLDDASRELIVDRDRLVGVSMSTGEVLDKVSRRLGGWFEPGVAVSIARLPESETIELDTWEGGTPKPLPGITLCLKIREGLNPKSLRSYLGTPESGFRWETPEPMESAVGELFRLPLRGKDLSLELMDPAFATVNGNFLYSTNAKHLQRCLEVIAGSREPLAKLDSFNAALDTVAKKGNLFLFVDGDRLRPFLRDGRYQYARDDVFIHPREYRKQVIIELNTEFQEWTNDQIMKEADRRVEQRLFQMKRSDFDEALTYYKSLLPLYEPLGWIGLSMTVAGDLGGQRHELKGEIRTRPLNGGSSKE